MFILKKFVKNLYKSFVQFIFKVIYGKIYLANDNEINDCQIVKSIRISNCEYKVFKVKQGRLFTTSIHDTAIIFKNKLVPQPSFQLRVKDGDKNYARNNSDIKDNITLKIGTPRILKKLKGKVFSLLSGGAAKTNYFHWLFEVLPRIEILKKCEEIENINFFLLPSIKMEHQLLTLELLGLSKKKFLDSNSFKHILSDELYIVDHPFRLTNNTVYDTQNIPFWIFAWIRNKFLKFRSKKIFPEKIFIERSKNLSIHRDIYNKEEVYNFFKSKDFKFLKPETYSFEDQIQIFFSAKEIVGLHGAAFANICFCNPKTKITEFKTVSTGMNSGNIALKNKLDYKGVICEAIDKFGGQQGKLIVPIDQLLEKI